MNPPTTTPDWTALRADFPILDQMVHGQPLVFYHFQGFKAVGPGLWDLGIDKYGAHMDAGLRSRLYGGYLRELRAADRLVRSRAPAIAKSGSIRLPRYGWRLVVKRLLNGQVIFSPGAIRL